MNSFAKVDLIKEAWALFRKNLNLFALLIGVYLIYFILQSAFQNTLYSIIFTVISVILEIGAINLVLHLVDGKKADIKDLYNYSDLPMKALKTFVGGIFLGIAVVLGLILLVIPGIYIAIRSQFFVYYIVDKNPGIVDAFKMSWNLTKNGVMNLFLFDLLLILLNIGGALLLGVGLLVTVPLSLVAATLLFRKFQK